MSLVTAEEFNPVFFDALRHNEFAKAGQVVGDYIQERIRESGFARKILDVQTVTENDRGMQVDPNGAHDGFEYVVPIEPNTVAQRVDFRGEPERVWIPGNRFAIRFQKISTNEFSKPEEELLAHREPVLKIIEQNSIKDMQEQEDIAFLDHVKAAAGLSTLRLNPTPAATGGFLGFTTGVQVDAFFKGAAPVANPRTSAIILSPNNYFRRDTIADMAKILLARQLELKVFLLHAQDFVDTLRWFADEVGHDIATKITIGGYKEATVGGFTFVTTIKTNRRLVQPGHIYGFADKTALGKFLILTAPKFWLNKRANLIQMQAWEVIGAGIGNINGCAMILLAGAEPLDLPVPAEVYTSGFLRIYPEGVNRGGGALPDA